MSTANLSFGTGDSVTAQPVTVTYKIGSMERVSVRRQLRCHSVAGGGGHLAARCAHRVIHKLTPRLGDKHGCEYHLDERNKDLARKVGMRRPLSRYPAAVGGCRATYEAGIQPLGPGNRVTGLSSAVLPFGPATPSGVGRVDHTSALRMRSQCDGACRVWCAMDAIWHN